jgi:nucleotide-binding universal stress UspA family protein
MNQEGNTTVNKILCPTRGGEASIPNQMQAIVIAKERGADLLFLYVSNIHFLNHITSPVPVQIVEKQLDELGEFVLIMAKERAGKAGVKAETVVRRGEFRAALDEVIREIPISTIILGAGSQGTGVTTPEYRQDLAQYLLKEHGIEIIISAEGEIAERYMPAEPENDK